MNVSPLLPQELVEQVHNLLHQENMQEEIIKLLAPLSLEEKVHILRFLYWNQLGSPLIILDVWRTFIAEDHFLNTNENRRALNEIGQWWNAFGESHAMYGRSYDELEKHLDAIGMTSEGKDYFRWVALYPVGKDKEIGKWSVWDDERRGAVICLAKYAYNRETEVFLARHLDDWVMIQVEVARILSALKSRVLARVAPWYVKYDQSLEPILKEYGFEAL